MCAQLGVPGPLNGRWRHRLETRSATCVCVRPAVGGRKGFNLTSAKTFRLWANINPKQAKNQNRPRTGVKPIQTQPKPVLTRLSRLITPLQTLYHGSGAAAGGPVLLDKCNTRLDPPTPRTTLDTAVISVPSYIEIAAFRPLNKSCPHAADPIPVRPGRLRSASIRCVATPTAVTSKLPRIALSRHVAVMYGASAPKVDDFMVPGVFFMRRFMSTATETQILGP
jgi:hypothetical protein